MKFIEGLLIGQNLNGTEVLFRAKHSYHISIRQTTDTNDRELAAKTESKTKQEYEVGVQIETQGLNKSLM